MKRVNTPEQIEELKQLVANENKECPLPDIALSNQTGLSRQMVHYYRTKFDIPPRFKRTTKVAKLVELIKNENPYAPLGDVELGRILDIPHYRVAWYRRQQGILCKRVRARNHAKELIE